MENKTNQSKNLVDTNQLFKLLVMVAALLCLLFVAYKLAMLGGKKPVSVQPAQVEKTNVEFTKLPEKFPTNIPLEKDSRVIQNFNTTTPDGQFQAVRTFETAKSLDENLKLYTDFLKKEGWQIVATVDKPAYKMITGQLGSKFISISIDDNKVTEKKSVSISYTENQTPLAK